TPTEMALGLEGSNRMLRPPTRWTIYRPNVTEAAVRLLKFPELVREAAWEVARHPSKLNPMDLIGMMSPLLPSGFFTSSQLIRYLDRLFAGEELVDDFRRVAQDVDIVACPTRPGEGVA